MRRSELLKLTHYDIDRPRRLLVIRQGEGRKDRIVPIGLRAIEWLEKYLRDVRPWLEAGNGSKRRRKQLPVATNRLILSNTGGAMRPEVLSALVRVFNWSDADDSITVSSPSTHELHGFYIQEPSNVASVDQSNQQYSILALTDSSGNVSERYAYTAYGQPTFLNASATVQTSSAAGNRYTYTAREWDSTLGLHHFRARWMSGLTGRFLSRDPIGYFGSRWGLYTIVEGEVLSLVDPSGQRSVLPIDVDDGPCRNRSGSRGHGNECRRCANLLRDFIARENARTAPTLQEILDGLPSCPCSSKRPARVFYRSDKCGNVTYTDLGFENSLPEGWAWDTAVSYPIIPIFFYQVWSFHPGADKCMRSHGGRHDRSTQQCCYDSNGGLITSGPGAVSPDINDPDHFAGEVDPFLGALYLDDSEVGGRHRGRPSQPGFNVGLYNSLRPSNNGKGCKDNPTPQ